MPSSPAQGPQGDVEVDAARAAVRREAAVRLEYLDGLRGLSAVYVVLGHIYISLIYFSTEIHLPRWLVALMKLFNIGQTAVDIFIVLSGYCLMLPVVRAAGQLRGGFREYIRRRAVRILPPYYAALLLGLAISVGLLAMGYESARINDWPGSVVSHVLLIHNFNLDWIHEIDPPMWSVAVEWQIYFVFPALLLPIWRAFGPLASMLAGLALGLGLHFLPGGAFDHSFPWYIGLFALGNMAATLNFSTSEHLVKVRERVPWGWLSAASWLPAAGFFASTPGWYKNHQWQADHLIGFATACLLVSCTRSALSETPTLVLRVLRSRVAVFLGAFSYSLYLVHYPLLVLFWNMMMRVSMSSMARALVMYGVGFPFLMTTAYLFYLRFERPFMTGHARARRAGEPLPSAN